MVCEGCAEGRHEAGKMTGQGQKRRENAANSCMFLKKAVLLTAICEKNSSVSMRKRKQEDI